MARRSSGSSAGGIALIVIGWVLWQLFHNQEALEWLGGIAAAMLTIVVIIHGVRVDQERRRSELQWTTASSIIQRHAPELTIRRRQLTTNAGYGLKDDSKWNDDAAKFVAFKIVPEAGPIDSQSANLRRIFELINHVTSDFDSVRSDFSPTMDPVAYEHMVADRLTDLGWKTRVTKGSGDQGIDVVAEMRNAKVVIQCKLYSSPVGNSAVQEVIGGKAFEMATHAAVVSNAAFTPSALRLAASGSVYLLHHDDLQRLEHEVFGTSRQREKAPVASSSIASSHIASSPIVAEYRPPVSKSVRPAVLRIGGGVVILVFCALVYFYFNAGSQKLKVPPEADVVPSISRPDVIAKKNLVQDGATIKPKHRARKPANVDDAKGVVTDLTNASPADALQNAQRSSEDEAASQKTNDSNGRP